MICLKAVVLIVWGILFKYKSASFWERVDKVSYHSINTVLYLACLI